MTPTRYSDPEIRPALRQRVFVSHDADPDTVVIEELGLCRGLVRVDLAVVNGIIHGYEIKSDRDNLHRLEGQVELYSKVLDRATLVTSERHLDAAIKLLPSWWGVQRVEATPSGSPCLKMVRRGRMNTKLDARALAELLWLEDALALLEDHGAVKGMRGKPRRFVWDRVCESIDLKVIAAAVRTRLKARATLLAPQSP